MIIDINGEKCECGNRGCLQTIVSGKAIAKRGNKRLKESPDSLTAKDLFEMAENGCQTCIELFRETGVIIGIGLTNFIHLVNPGKIVLGRRCDERREVHIAGDTRNDTAESLNSRSEADRGDDNEARR
jgi:predicted NBD/HSP70 family sugar kinase